MRGGIGDLARIHPALKHIAGHLGDSLPLAALARKAGLSPFQFHRMFSRAIGETPKRYSLRLRLGRAAATLLTSNLSVLDVALNCGFESHEVFCRAFRARFGMAPREYRRRGLISVGGHAQSFEHEQAVDRVARCVGLYARDFTTRIPGDRTAEMTNSYTVVQKELRRQPVLLVRRRVKRSEIAKTIGEALPHVFWYAEKHGIALTGHPFTRYVEMGVGMVTIEPGMRIAAPADPALIGARDEPSEVLLEALPSGPAATVMHAGAYESLADAYAAIEEWMAAQGKHSAGPPWESYITDPADFPDPKDWKTEVLWPLAE